MEKTFRLFSIAVLALAMAACDNEDNVTEQPPQQAKIPFSATLVAPGNGATTRTTYTESEGSINVAWKIGDAIQIVNDNTPANSDEVTVGTINSNGSATISGSITAGANGDEITAYYPASSQTNWDVFRGKFEMQDGTLAYIQDNLDYRIGHGSLSVSGDPAAATLGSSLKMDSKIAIWKLTLKDDAATPSLLSATKVTIKNGEKVIASTSTISPTSSVYLALPLVSDIAGGAITIKVTTESGTYYFYSKSGINLSAGKFYQSTVKMTYTPPAIGHALASAVVGEIIGSDGKAYAATDKDILPIGVSAVAVVAYVGSEGSVEKDTTYRGLAIATNDANGGCSCLWYNEGGGTCVSQTDKVTTALGYLDGIACTETLLSDGHTHAAATAARSNNGTSAPTGCSDWFLPSMGQWQLIVQGLTGKSTALSTSTNLDYTESNVNAKITAAGGDDLDGVYWASTEYDTDNAWYISFENASADKDYKTFDYWIRVRSVLAF